MTLTYTTLNQCTGPTFVAPDGRTTATGAIALVLPDPVSGRIYRVIRANFNSGVDTAQRYWNFFVQDSWKAGNRLTINPGLRYEQETLDGVQVKGFALKNNWAPRIGAAYDATGDGKTKIFGNWGRFYARLPNDVAARQLSADELITRADYFDAALDPSDSDRSPGWRSHQPFRGAEPRTRPRRFRREDVVHQRVRVRHRARGDGQYVVRGSVHLPGHRPYPRGRGQCSGRVLRNSP